MQYKRKGEQFLSSTYLLILNQVGSFGMKDIDLNLVSEDKNQGTHPGSTAQPALEYVTAGGVKIVGEGVNPQIFATELQARINQTLIELQNEGVISKLAMDWQPATHCC